MPPESIEIGMKCVAYSNNDEKWYRAKVLELEENDQVKVSSSSMNWRYFRRRVPSICMLANCFQVFFKDVAREETVKSQNLRKLEPEFDKLVDGAVACNMVNIEERAKWPARLCELLMNTLDSYSSVYLTKFKMVLGENSSVIVFAFYSNIYLRSDCFRLEKKAKPLYR